MGYKVLFLSAKLVPERSGIFETIQEAHAFAAQQAPIKKPNVIAILEIDADGNDGRVHALQVVQVFPDA
jgi:hypothetical protein